MGKKLNFRSTEFMFKAKSDQEEEFSKPVIFFLNFRLFDVFLKNTYLVLVTDSLLPCHLRQNHFYSSLLTDLQNVLKPTAQAFWLCHCFVSCHKSNLHRVYFGDQSADVNKGTDLAFHSNQCQDKSEKS